MRRALYSGLVADAALQQPLRALAAVACATTGAPLKCKTRYTMTRICGTASANALRWKGDKCKSSSTCNSAWDTRKRRSLKQQKERERKRESATRWTAPRSQQEMKRREKREKRKDERRSLRADDLPAPSTATFQYTHTNKLHLTWAVTAQRSALHCGPRKTFLQSNFDYLDNCLQNLWKKHSTILRRSAIALVNLSTLTISSKCEVLAHRQSPRIRSEMRSREVIWTASTISFITFGTGTREKFNKIICSLQRNRPRASIHSAPECASQCLQCRSSYHHSSTVCVESVSHQRHSAKRASQCLHCRTCNLRHGVDTVQLLISANTNP